MAYVPGELIKEFIATIEPSKAVDAAFEAGIYDGDYVVVREPFFSSTMAFSSVTVSIHGGTAAGGSETDVDAPVSGRLPNIVAQRERIHSVLRIIIQTTLRISI